MRKICFVIQRYGEEVNGGAELHCKQLAEHLVSYYDVNVLTTKAIDYVTWKDEYTADREDINGVHVRRFSVPRPRVWEEFDKINIPFLKGELPEEREQEWIDAEGPYCPELVDYIKDHKDDYDLFLFFTYLYYPSVMGMPHVKDKAILFALAHDEPFLRMESFANEIKSPRAIFFNTDEERRLLRKKFDNYDVPGFTGGVGVEVPDQVSGEKFRKKYGLDRYIVYVGRISEGKNCKEMFDFWAAYKEKHPGDLKLVLMGKPVIEVPEREDIVSLGFVSDQDKFDGIAGSEFLLLPSKYESLSMVVLEAFSLKKSVLVNGQCEVLKAHCKKSGAGAYYRNYEEFETCMNEMLSNPAELARQGILGQKYVNSNYRWEIIVRKLMILIEWIAGKTQ